MAKESPFGGLAVAFRNRQFLIYTVGSVPSQLGTWMQRVAVQALAWDLTESELMLGVIGFLDLFPVVFVGPVAGALADRIDRLAFGRLVQTLTILHGVVLTVLVMTGWITIEWLIGLTLFLGILHAMFQPFRQSIIANLVTGDELPPAIAVNSIGWHTSRVVGPALAGVMLYLWGVGPTIAVTTVTYVFFVIALYRIHLPPSPRARRSLAEIPAEIVDGVRYAAGHPVIGPLLMILLLASFLGRPVLELLVAYSEEVYDMGALGLAWLTSAGGAGAVAAGVWLGRRGTIIGLVDILVINLFGTAASLILFAMLDNFWLAVPAMAVVGFTLIINGITIQTLVQSTVDGSLRGRVMSLYGLVWLGFPALGAVLLGGLTELYGLRWPLVGFGALCFAVWVWARTRRRALIREVEGE